MNFLREITGSVSRAIYPSGSLVPVRQAVGSVSETETFYPTANRPAAPIVVCRIQFQSASQDGGLARIERPNSRAFLASLLAGATPAGFIRALLQTPQQPSSRFSQGLHYLQSFVAPAFHEQKSTTGEFGNVRQVLGVKDECR